jgi:hypothetical protein
MRWLYSPQRSFPSLQHKDQQPPLDQILQGLQMFQALLLPHGQQQLSQVPQPPQGQQQLPQGPQPPQGQQQPSDASSRVSW